MNEKKARSGWAVGPARHNLGVLGGEAGNYRRAFKHSILAAGAGDKFSFDAVKSGSMSGFVTKDKYANTLRESKKSQDDMKSDARDKALSLYAP